MCVCACARARVRVRGPTLLVLPLPQAVLGLPEDAQVRGEVVHQAGSEVRLPVHLLGPKDTRQTVTNTTTLDRWGLTLRGAIINVSEDINVLHG